MDLTVLVSLVNACTLAIALLGCTMFFSTPAYRGVCLLLALISVAALFNVLEDLRFSRNLYLISPIFVFGFGPAFYLAAKRLIVGPVGYAAAWHFLPMMLALPFTEHVQAVIAAGTVSRIAYAFFTLKLIIAFNQQLTKQRSDAMEVSLAWLGGLVGISTLVGALDLLRLNSQLALGAPLNMIGYTTSSLAFFVIVFLLILMLNNRREGLESLAGSIVNQPAAFGSTPKKMEESAADYQSLFAILDREIRAQQWYCQSRLTLNELANLSGMTTRDISRSINLVAGMSFNDYINQFRVAHIKQLMQGDADTNLMDLAFAAGFSSKATFNQSFKKATAMTPSEFRTMKLSGDVQNQDSSRPVSG